MYIERIILAVSLALIVSSAAIASGAIKTLQGNQLVLSVIQGAK